MEPFYNHPQFQRTLLYSPCAPSAPAAVMLGKEVREHEADGRCPNAMGLVFSNSAPAQLIIGSLAGVATGIAAQKKSKEWAIPIGVGLLGLRLSPQVSGGSIPICQNSMDFINEVLDSSIVFAKNNFLVITGFVMLSQAVLGAVNPQIERWMHGVVVPIISLVIRDSTMSTFLYSPCSSAAIAAMMKAKVVREMEELEDCQRRAELLRLMECTSAQSQFIIGSAAGVLTGYFGSKGGGKGCAVVAGVGLVAIRTVMHLMTRTTPFIMCGIEPQSLDLMERIVDESKTIFRRNIYVVTGFLLGYIAYRIS